jgi:hypothetical protein
MIVTLEKKNRLNTVRPKVGWETEMDFELKNYKLLYSREEKEMTALICFYFFSQQNSVQPNTAERL